MRIALIGYGKMGKTIERLALNQGHSIVMKTNELPTKEELTNANPDVAIEFSNPNAAFENILQLIKNKIPTISGTTGWTDNLPKIEQKVTELNGSFIYASNFSLGVNLFFAMVKHASQLMRNQSLYSTSIEEIHHTEKKDAPSGTAITLAEHIIHSSDYNSWQLGKSNDMGKDTIPIEAIRELDVPGTHIIKYESELDTIELKHTAYSRDSFALGALKAAEFIYQKQGVYSMKDVLGL